METVVSPNFNDASLSIRIVVSKSLSCLLNSNSDSGTSFGSGNVNGLKFVSMTVIQLSSSLLSNRKFKTVRRSLVRILLLGAHSHR